jgi:hypothetical protein
MPSQEDEMTDEVTQDQVTDTTAQAESPAIADQNAEPAPADKDQPKVDHDKIQRRIDKLTREKYQSRGEVEALRKEIESLRSQQTQRQETKATGAPRLEDFSNLDDYVAAKAEHVADQKLAKAFEERDSKQRESSQQNTEAQRAAAWEKSMIAAAKEIPDIAEVIESADAPLTRAMAEAIMESEMGPRVAYYLAQNPEEAERLAGLNPVSVARAIGRIEAKLESEAATKKSSAPKPAEPVSSRGAATKDPGKMSDSEYAKWRKAGRRAA